jgi:hypothetical protein
MHVGKLLALWRRKVSSLAVDHIVHADNVLRGLSAAADGVEAASSSAKMLETGNDVMNKKENDNHYTFFGWLCFVPCRWILGCLIAAFVIGYI